MPSTPDGLRRRGQPLHSSFKEIAIGYQVTRLRTIATCAVREARNGTEFCRRIREEVGLEVEVISGEREARLAFLSVQHAFDLSGRNTIVADIGGGSTEIVFATGNLIESIFSTPLGAVRLTEQFGLGDCCDGPDTARSLERLDEEIAGVLKKRTAKPLFAPHLLVEFQAKQFLLRLLQLVGFSGGGDRAKQTADAIEGAICVVGAEWPLVGPLVPNIQHLIHHAALCLTQSQAEYRLPLAIHDDKQRRDIEQWRTICGPRLEPRVT